jgi:hypothetical protein
VVVFESLERSNREFGSVSDVAERHACLFAGMPELSAKIVRGLVSQRLDYS